MNGLLKFYTTEQIEAQKSGYRGEWRHSVFVVNGNYIPSWMIETSSGSGEKLYLEELSLIALDNGQLDVITSTLIDYGANPISYDNGCYWASKKAVTLTGIYRYKLDIDGTLFYSDLFMKYDIDVPLYIRVYNNEYVRVYKY